MERRRKAFTLIELLVVIFIIMILASLLIAAAGMARRAARVERSKATVNIIAAACESYWTIYHDYPYPVPDFIGVNGTNTVGASLKTLSGSDLTLYYTGGAWTAEANNVALVYLLAMDRQPAPLINIQEPWYVKIKQNLNGPNGKALFRVVDAFSDDKGSPCTLVVERDWQYYTTQTWIRITSMGPDWHLSGNDPNDNHDYAKDNIVVYLRR